MTMLTSGVQQKRRDRHDLVAEILRVAREGRIKTHIMYKAKLSYAQLNKYLQFLVDKGFVENQTIGQKTIYKTTLKGIGFLDSYDGISNLWAQGQGGGSASPSIPARLHLY